MHRRAFLISGLFFTGIGKSFAVGSWQSYADRIIASRNAVYAVIGSCEQSANYGVWVTAGSLPTGEAVPRELEALVMRFACPANGQKLIIAGKQYGVTNCNRDFITGRVGAHGIAVAKSNKTLIIGCSGEGQKQGILLDTVTQIARELMAAQY